MSPERIKSIRKHMLLASILLLVLGICFIAWPDEAARILARATAIVIIAVGVFELILFFIGKKKEVVDIPAIISGVLLGALGIYLLIQPDTMLKFFNIIFGIIIIIIGLDHIFQAIFIIRHIRSLWWISLIVGLVALGLGVLTLLNPFCLAFCPLDPVKIIIVTLFYCSFRIIIIPRIHDLQSHITLIINVL